MIEMAWAETARNVREMDKPNNNIAARAFTSIELLYAMFILTVVGCLSIFLDLYLAYFSLNTALNVPLGCTEVNPFGLPPSI